MLSVSYLILFKIFVITSLVGAKPIKSVEKIRFDTVISFGDSYSDNGSFDKFYQQGGHMNVLNSSANNGNVTSELHRWSNGLVLVEHLASLLQSSLYDFSRSGATTNNNLYPRSTEDVNTQTVLYIQSNIANSLKDSTLYIIWIGVNDMHDLFKKENLNYTEKLLIMEQGLDTLETSMHRIYNNGAKHQAILGLIPLTEARLFESLNDSRKNELQNLVKDYNKGVKNRVDKFNKDTNQSTVFFFDVYNTYYQLFKHVDPPITSCNSQVNCGDIIWWDDLHPTAQTHFKLAQKIVASL